MDSLKYAKEYMEFMEEVYKNNHVLNVSTITLICNLNVERLCIATFCEVFNESGVDVKRCKPNKEFEVTKRGKIKKTFFNQVTLNYKDISKKSIKVFSNGKLQITGLTSYLECNYVAQMVTKWLQKALSNTDIKVTHMYVGMINSNFSVKKNLDLVRLNQLLNTHNNVMSIYNPESYPAINMKYIDDTMSVSIFVFGTGNIVITGGKELEHMRKAYQFIHHVISTNHSMVCKTTKHVPKIKNNEPYVNGYPIRQYMSCMYD